jgi:WD40 repeat protein
MYLFKILYVQVKFGSMPRVTPRVIPHVCNGNEAGGCGITNINTSLCSALLYTCLQWPSRLAMSELLEYQECYHKPAHTSTINAMVVNHNGRRLVTGSDDSTAIVWSTQNGSTLCRIKTHSRVLSLAWVGSSSGFLLGCEDGRLASVDVTQVLYAC